MKFEISFLKDCYEKFLKDETILSLTQLAKICGISISSNKNIQIFRNSLYDLFGKNELSKLSRSRFAKYRLSKRKNYTSSKESNNKRAKSLKSFYKAHPERKEVCRKLMKQYCAPNSHTASSNTKRVESRKRNGNPWHSEETKTKISLSQRGVPKSEEVKKKFSIAKIGKPSNRLNFKHSSQTKKKLSEITKEQWKRGIHKPTYQSKGQLQLANKIRQLGYSVEIEHIIDGVAYDIYVNELNLIVEFNGTYWHRDARFYSLDEQVKKIYKRDAFKREFAIQNGFNFKVVWQHDWETKNQQEIVERLTK